MTADDRLARGVPEYAPRVPVRDSNLPSERDWQRSAVLEPQPGSRHPQLISDGGGLPFPPAALAGRPGPLDPEDPAASALLAHLAALAAPKHTFRAPWKRRAGDSQRAQPTLDGWRLLARTDRDALFAHGDPPKLLTVALRRARRRGSWAFLASSSAQPLRCTRDGIRASSWRLDPTHEPQPDETELRVLVTEQTFASGKRADGRVLPPEIYVDEEELVLTIFVTPRPGYQAGSRNPETPIRVALPHPVGSRRLVDGALARLSPPRASPPPTATDPA